jgi:hypothetical protein
MKTHFKKGHIPKIDQESALQTKEINEAFKAVGETLKAMRIDETFKAAGETLKAMRTDETFKAAAEALKAISDSFKSTVQSISSKEIFFRDNNKLSNDKT